MPRFFPYDASKLSLFQPCRAAIQTPFFAGWRPATEATLCAELCRLAYCASDTIRSVLATIDMEFVDEVAEPSGIGTFGFLARGAQGSVLAFRGTEPDDPTDIFDDARFIPVPWDAGGQVHAGFADALLRVQNKLRSLLGTVNAPLSFTGHSLGAALATLATSLGTNLGGPHRLITFGSPRVGDAAFGAALAQTTEGERYVDCADIVCQIPPALEYAHFGQLRYIDYQGELHLDPTEAMIAEDQIAGHLEYTLSYVWKRGNAPSRSLADHAPINYVSALVGSQP